MWTRWALKPLPPQAIPWGCDHTAAYHTPGKIQCLKQNSEKEMQKSLSFTSKFAQGTVLNKRQKAGHAGLVLAFPGLPHLPPILLKQPRHRAVQKSCSQVPAGVLATQSKAELLAPAPEQAPQEGTPGAAWILSALFLFCRHSWGKHNRAHSWYPKAGVYVSLLFLNLYINCGQITLCLSGSDPYCTPNETFRAPLFTSLKLHDKEYWMSIM